MVNLLFSEMCEPSKALLYTGHPPARVRQIFGFAKVSAGGLVGFPTQASRRIAGAD